MSTIGASILDFSKDRLRKQKTRITTRTGKIYEETRAIDGSFNNVFVGQGPKPQYIKEMESGFSKLSTYGFNKLISKWEVHKSFESHNVANKPTLKFVSYNVWFSEENWINRATALFNLIKQQDPDFICLQEVTPHFLKYLLEYEFFQKLYFINDITGSTVIPYGVLILSKFSFFEMNLYDMPSNMGRRFLFGKVLINDDFIHIGTVHLESMDNAPIREAQLQVMNDINKKELSKSWFILGDFNFNEYMRENRYIEQFDIWHCLHGSNSPLGLTRRGPMIDRALSGGSAYRPRRISRIGTRPIADNRPIGLTDQVYLSSLPDSAFPSDHDGLVVEFDYVPVPVPV